MKYEYNYENSTEKRASQEKYGRLDIPHDDPAKHPEHLRQHEHLQILQREALNGNVDRVKEMLDELPEHQKKDTIELVKRSVESVGRTIDL
tara:strand:- start:3 stop:275 length:273 start_codon:yes stop_codon:yes gene_type:complete